MRFLIGFGPFWVPIWGRFWSKKGPKRRPRAQDGIQEGTQGHPKSLRDAIVPLGARQVDARMRPREPKAARARFCIPFWDPDGAPRVPNETKKRTKSDWKNIFVSVCILGSTLTDLEVQKASLLGPEKGSKCMQRL